MKAQEVELCHKKLDTLQCFNDREICAIIVQSSYDENVIRHALLVSYNFHHKEKVKTWLGEPEE